MLLLDRVEVAVFYFGHVDRYTFYPFSIFRFGSFFRLDGFVIGLFQFLSFDDFKKAFDGKVERAVNARELVMLLSR